MKKKLATVLCLSVFMSSCFLSPPQPVNDTNNNNSSSGNASNNSSGSNSNSGNLSNNNSDSGSTSNNNSQSNNSNSGSSSSGNNSNSNSSNNNSGSGEQFSQDYTESEVDTKEKEQVKATVNIIDAGTEQIVNKPVEVIVVGDDRDKIEKTEFISNTGVITLFLKRGIKPEPDRPFSVKLLVEIDGFIPTNIPVLISNNLDSALDKNFSLEEKVNFNQSNLKMVNLTNLPQGVANSSSKISASNTGQLQNDLKVDIIDSRNNVKTNVSIAKDTILLSENGEPLVGELKCNFTYFNPTSESALQSFPGGLNVTTLKNQIKTEGNFISAGLVSLSITDEKGRQADKVVSPVANQQAVINVTMQVPRTVPNPIANRPLNPMDLIPYWSYNRVTGNWEYLGEVQIINEGNINTFTAKFSIYNFNMYNLDYYLNIVGSVSCYPKIIFKRNAKDKIQFVYYYDYINISGTKFFISKQLYSLGLGQFTKSSLIEQSISFLPFIPNFEHETIFTTYDATDASYIYNNTAKPGLTKIVKFNPKNSCESLIVDFTNNQTTPITSGGGSSGGGSSLGGGSASSGLNGSGS